MFSKYVSGEIMKCEIGGNNNYAKRRWHRIKLQGITYGKIIPHLQEIFNNERIR